MEIVAKCDTNPIKSDIIITHKGGFKRMNYKTLIIELISKIDNEKYLKYIHTLIKTLSD